MSVYTTLTLQEVQAFAAPYGLEVIDLIPIQGGIQNTNYFIVCENAVQYVLTVFEEMDEQGAGELVPVLEHLGQAGLAVPVPLSHSGKAIHSLKEKPAQIAPRMMGKHPMPATLEQAEAIAIAQAQMHVALQDFPLERAEYRDLEKDGRPCPKRKGRTFNCFVNALKYQGYSVEYKELKACDFGSPTIRNRFFLIARRDGLPIVWPKETHGNPNTSLVKKGRLLPWRTAAECVDLSFDCPSIFKRKKALAPATLERIVRGILKYIVHNPEPYIVDAAAPILTECANGSSRRSMPIDEPLRTITAETKGGTHSLYVCHLSKMKNGCTGQELNEPMHTLTTVNQFAEVRALLTRFTEGLNFKNELFEKFGIIEINGERYCIEDIGFRMLQPFELYKAQGFPHDYIFSYGHDENNQQLKLTKQDQYRMVGNSVPPDLSYALVLANFTHEQEYSLAS